MVIVQQQTRRKDISCDFLWGETVQNSTPSKTTLEVLVKWDWSLRSPFPLREMTGRGRRGGECIIGAGFGGGGLLRYACPSSESSMPPLPLSVIRRHPCFIFFLLVRMQQGNMPKSNRNTSGRNKDYLRVEHGF